MMLSAQQMRSLPDFFIDIPDPRRAKDAAMRSAHRVGHRLRCDPVWHARLQGDLPTGPKASVPKPERDFVAVVINGRYVVPSESIIRDVTIRVEPAHLDAPLQRWNESYGQNDTTLAIDGKTLCNAINAQGHQPTS